MVFGLGIQFGVGFIGTGFFGGGFGLGFFMGWVVFCGFGFVTRLVVVGLIGFVTGFPRFRLCFWLLSARVVGLIGVGLGLIRFGFWVLVVLALGAGWWLLVGLGAGWLGWV